MADFDTSVLTDKQIKFCEEYLIDLNAKQAAIRAGYSENSAAEIGCENLIKPNVSAYIQFLQKELSDKTKITHVWVLNRFKEISDRCMTAEPVMIHDGENWVESGQYKFDSSGANKATEMIGRHLGFFEADNNQKVADISGLQFSLKKKSDNERPA